MKVNNVFRLLRIARDMSVKDLANELLVTPAYIHAIESGVRQPSDRLVRDYARVMRINPEVITNFSEEAKKNSNFEHLLMWVLENLLKTNPREFQHSL